MAVDDVIKAARNMARTTSQVLDNSKTATKALNKIISDHGTALNNAKKIVNSNTTTKALNEIVNDHGTALNNAKKIVKNNTATKSINNIVQEHGTALNNAKKVAQTSTSAPSRYDARGNYQQALEKAKEIAGGNTTTRAINNVPKTSEIQPRMPIIDTSMPNSGPQASPIIRNTPINNTSGNGPKYGPRVDSSGSGNKPPNGPKITVNMPEPPEMPEIDYEKIKEGINNYKEAMNNQNQQKQGFSFGEFGNKYFGGITDTYKGTRAGDGFWNSLESAHKNADGTMRWDRIAGTYAAVALGSRVLSGGGVYKDKYGNTNLPGIPFI